MIFQLLSLSHDSLQLIFQLAPLVISCLLLFIILLSSLSILWGINIYTTEKNSQHWPTKTAIVKASRITESTNKFGTTYCPEWQYEFYVNSKKYTSSRAAFGTYSCFKHKSEAELKLNTHPIGSSAKAIYDPENPSYAALQLSNSSELYWMLILLGGFCVVAGIVNIAALIQLNKIRT